MNINGIMKLPMVCTRGVIIFPQQDVMIEVGRPKSINAVNIGGEKYDSLVFLVCQSDIMADDPKQEDLYTVGTIARIKVVRRKEGFLRVTFTGMQRARIVSVEDSDSMMFAEVEVLHDVFGDKAEEQALVKK